MLIILFKGNIIIVFHLTPHEKKVTGSLNVCQKYQTIKKHILYEGLSK